jgi:hypothetical protein
MGEQKYDNERVNVDEVRLVGPRYYVEWGFMY